MRILSAWFLAWLIVGVASVAALTTPPVRIPADRLGLRRIQVPLQPNMTVSQTFAMTADGLYAIEMAPARGEDAVAGRLRLELHEEGSDLVRSTEVSAATFMSGSSYRFEFDPIEDSRDAVFRLDLFSSASSPAKGIAVWATKGERSEGTLLINGRERWADLAFRTFAPGGRSAWRRLLDVASVREHYRGAIVFGLLAAYWGVLGLVLRVLWTSTNEVAPHR